MIRKLKLYALRTSDDKAWWVTAPTLQAAMHAVIEELGDRRSKEPQKQDLPLPEFVFVQLLHDETLVSPTSWRDA